MEPAKKKRIERRKKLKRVFNYDAEMAFLETFWNMKKTSCSIDEFKKIVKKALIDTEQVSDVVAQYFIEELRIKEIIIKKQKELLKVDQKQKTLYNEIKDLEDSLKVEKEEEEESDSSYGGTDSCGHSTRIRSLC
jgi:hypothetical protein